VQIFRNKLYAYIINIKINVRCLRLVSQDVHQFRFQSRSKKFWNAG